MTDSISMTITMKSAIERILTAHGELAAFNRSRSYSLKVRNEPYMPLSIERHGNIATVTHYYEQNGDLVPDPDMEFLVSDPTCWQPLAITHATGHYFRAADYEAGEWVFHPKCLSELEEFSRMWAENLIAQGFEKGRPVQSASSDSLIIRQSALPGLGMGTNEGRGIIFRKVD